MNDDYTQIGAYRFCTKLTPPFLENEGYPVQISPQRFGGQCAFAACAPYRRYASPRCPGHL
eukprot:6201808-Pleurochrysis_carterae.AAC.2